MTNRLILEIYESDTEKTLVDRLSERSLPKFIYITSVNDDKGKRIATEITHTTIDTIKLHKKIVVEYIDLYERVREIEPNATSFCRFHKTFSRAITELNVLVDMLYIWAASFFTTQTGFEELHLDSAYTDVKECIPGIEEAIEKFLYNPFNKSNIEAYNTHLFRTINEHGNFVQRLNNSNEAQRAIKGVLSTPFKISKTRVVCKTDLRNVSLYEIFDTIELSLKVPFSSFGKFYKILKNSRIKSEWKVTDNEKIVVKFISEYGADPIDIYFFIQDSTVCISYEFEPSGKIKSENVRSVLKSVTPTLKYTLDEEQFYDVSGVFYVPNQRLNIYILEHLILNDARFSNFFIDESEKATKSKTGTYIYFNHINDMVSAIVTPKIKTKYDPTMKDESKKLFPENSEYLRVKISGAKTEIAANAFIKAFCKIIALYNSSEAGIVAIYMKYIGFLERDIKKDDGQKASSKDNRLSTYIDPELIPPGWNYSRKCAHRPRVLDDEETEEFENVVTYPREDDTSGLTSRKYTCDTYEADGFTNFGLQPGPNIPIPCCFSTDQSEGLYGKYIGLPEVKKRQQHFITTNKILPYLLTGTLDPFPEIKNMLGISDDKFIVLRRGVDDSPMSFLQCILEAIGEDEQTPRDKKGYATEAGENGRKAGLTKRLREFSENVDFLQSTKQALYDKSLDDIKEMLTSGQFLNPVFFKEAFEIFYNCRIVVFNPMGIELSRTSKSHVQTYIDDKRPVILILSHKGGGEIRPNPQCELLYLSDKTVPKSTKYLFRADEVEPIRYILETHNRMIQSQLLSEQIKSTIPFYDLVQSQLLNSFGKTTAYITKDGYFLYLKTPIAPLALPVDNRSAVVYSGRQSVRDMRRIFPGCTIRQIRVDGLLTTLEVTTKPEKIVFYVPVKRHTDPATSLEVADTSVIIPVYSSSVLDKFSYNQKVARYIREFMCYVFSQYINDKGIRVLNNGVIRGFIGEKISMDPRVEYEISFSKLFSENKKVFINGAGKLRIKSDELLRRLIYCLRVDITQRHQEIFEYYKRTHIENFIVDVGDFKVFPQQIIVEGEEAVSQYMKEYITTHPITHSVNPYFQATYFFTNDLIDEYVYVAKNTTDLNQAISCLNNYRTHGVLRSEPENITPVLADIYQYVSNINISPIEPPINSVNKILIYNSDGEIGYTVLLRL